MTFKRVLYKLLHFGYIKSGLEDFLKTESETIHFPLAGDRCIEWQWVLDNLPQGPAKVLDVGCTHSITAGFAAIRGLDVTGVDLLDLGYGIPNLTFTHGDITQMNFAENSFDYIVLCSVLEHISLEGRYSSSEKKDGDLQMMYCAWRWLKPGGWVLLTIPVGKDKVIRPMHKIYGNDYLPLIFQHFKIVKEEYWVKDDNRSWLKTEKEVALATEGRADFYALGLFILQKVE